MPPAASSPSRVALYARLMRLDKPIGILLLLWPTLWGLWLSANGHPDWKVVAIFVLGTVLMRSAGCVINDYADRDFDLHVARTAQRPMATRKIGAREAFTLFAVLVSLAFLVVLPVLTWPMFGMALVALFLAASYPFTKRFLAVPQAYLGVAFGFSIPMAWLAHTGTIAPVAWLLLGANVFWAIAYDTEYAMVDREDDLKIGIHTSAITFGGLDVIAVAVCYALALALLALSGRQLGLGTGFYLGLAAAGVLMARHVWMIRRREPAVCFKAFLDNNYVGGLIFAGIALDALLD